MHISPGSIFNVYMDEGSAVVATANNVPKGIQDQTTFYLCWPHKLHGIGQKMNEHEEFHGPLWVLKAWESAEHVQSVHWGVFIPP